MPTSRSALEEKIKDFAIDEGILGKKVPENPKLEFGYELNYPPRSPKPMRIMVIKPKETKAISIQIATQIAKPHVEAIKKKDSNGLMKFFMMFKKYMLTQNLLYNLDPKNARYIILENVYPDGLTENAFYFAIRKVFNAAVLMNMTVNEMIAGVIPKNKSIKDVGDMDFSNTDSMFT